MCVVLEVSESGYYRSLRCAKKPSRQELLLVKIQDIRNEHPDNINYGARRIHQALLNQGEQVSYSSVYRCMKKNGLLQKAPKHPNGITKADAAAQKAENLLQQDFKAEEPDTKYLTDITEVPCFDGKLYVVPVMDCFGGDIVGLAMDNNMRAEICVRALESACMHTGGRGMIVHSDRGSQYTSEEFRSSLARHGAVQSMSGTGNCYDNARMESFFATLKKEKLYRINTKELPMEEVKEIIFRYIMIYYNRQRIYTTNPDGMPPAIHRAAFYKKAA